MYYGTCEDEKIGGDAEAAAREEAFRDVCFIVAWAMVNLLQSSVEGTKRKDCDHAEV